MTNADMTQDTKLYLVGGRSPVSGVVHLFTEQDVQEATKLRAVPTSTTDEAVTPLCNTVDSYGPFTVEDEADGSICSNCERVRQQREENQW